MRRQKRQIRQLELCLDKERGSHEMTLRDKPPSSEPETEEDSDEMEVDPDSNVIARADDLSSNQGRVFIVSDVQLVY